jgi:predicted permease
VSLDGRPVDRAGDNTASMRFATPGYFRTMGIPLLAGRDFGDEDTRESLFVAVVSESFVRRYFPGQDPLGRTFQFGPAKRTIVGVAGDVRVRGIERTSEPQVYLPHRQINDGWMIFYPPKDLVLHTTLDASALAPAIRQIVKRVDSEQPVSDTRTLEQIVAGDTAPRRVQVGVLGAFAAVAFVLAAIGIYGLLSFAVSQRITEIGVRVALGASRGDILRLVLRQVTVLALVGTVLGIGLALAAGRSLSALLAGVAPTDPATMLAAAALALIMTLVGSLLPAIRALRVDPATALRAE